MRVGITERGDAGVDLSWVDKLQPANIIISKRLSNELIDQLVAHKHRIIFHMTCTGYGGSKVEPYVMNYAETFAQYRKLTRAGFPYQQVVLRVDPIVPTDKGLAVAQRVLTMFRNTVKRVRFSFLDQYPHVVDRFKEAGIKPPWDGFTAPKQMRAKAIRILDYYEGYYEMESCAESTKYQRGCISQRDLDILGIDYQLTAGGQQRKGCMCAAEKLELLNGKYQCIHGCLYCYWKAKKVTPIA